MKLFDNEYVIHQVYGYAVIFSSYGYTYEDPYYPDGYGPVYKFCVIHEDQERGPGNPPVGGYFCDVSQAYDECLRIGLAAFDAHLAAEEV